MRRASPTLSAPVAGDGPLPSRRSDWATLSRLFPYLWQYKWRVVAALGFMVAAKVANVGVPLLLKQLVDAMTIAPGSAMRERPRVVYAITATMTTAVVAAPLGRIRRRDRRRRRGFEG